MEDKSTTIHVDPRGDLSLLVEYGNKETKLTKTYIVSTSVMCIASPVWCTMFDPEGRWAKASSCNEGDFRMLDDNPDELLITPGYRSLKLRPNPFFPDFGRTPKYRGALR